MMTKALTQEWKPPPGVRPEIFSDFLHQLKLNSYDIDKTLANLLDSEVVASTGLTKMVDDFHNGNWIPNKVYNELLQLNLHYPVLEIIENKNLTKTEMISGMEKILEDLREVAKRADMEPAEVVDDVIKAPGGEIASDVKAALDSKDIPDDFGDNYYHYVNANHASNSAFSEVVPGALQEALDKVEKLEDLVIRGRGQKVLIGWHRKMIPITSGQDAATFSAMNEAIRTTTINLRDASLKPGFNVDVAITKLKGDTLFEFATIPQSPKGFRKELWEQYYFPQVRDLWQMYRDQHANDVEEFFHHLNLDLSPFDIKLDVSEINNARGILNKAQTWDGFLREDQIRGMLNSALDRNDNIGVARAYAP
jgi:hypothetical protein